MSSPDIELHLVYEYVEAWATAQPDGCAVVERDEEVSYGTLLRRIDEFARALRDGGVAPGDRVALIVGNSTSFIVALVAIFRAGAIAVPLHVQLRQREVADYVSSCDARAIVAAREAAQFVEGVRGEAPQLDLAFLVGPGGLLEEGPKGTSHGSSVLPKVLLNHPAVTMFSTGSTGRARRVTRSHLHLAAEARSVVSAMCIDNSDRVLGVAPFFHAYGLINGLLCPLISGSTIYVAAEFFPSDIGRLIEEGRLTGFPGVPFMFQLLAEATATFDFSSLRYVLSAGAPLPADVARTFEARYGRRARQLYGSTETGVIAIQPATGASYESVGPAISGVAVEILDEAGRTIPQGSEGRVAIVSAFAASGHDGLQADRESSFVGNRFFPGDTGLIDGDGNLVLLGRSRGFVNVGGNKVDPTEVEMVLKEMPAIQDAVVVGLPDGAAGEKLKAFLVARAPCKRDDVLAYLRSRLADYKRPRFIEFRDELPRSPLGKILRKYLVESEGEPSFAFDPHRGFVKSEFVVAGEKAPRLEILSPILRTILVGDGTVTRMLEAFFWEPIGVDVLLHRKEELEEACPELGLAVGAPIVRRQVLLRGRFTTTIYAFAETIILDDALTSDFRRRLLNGERGIGELIREGHIETYRELVGIERLLADQWALQLEIDSEAEVVRRRYTIAHEGRPAILIAEVFPERRF